MITNGRVVDYIVDHLAATGVEFLFGVDGANVEDLYDAAHFHGAVTAVLAKHEFSRPRWPTATAVAPLGSGW